MNFRAQKPNQNSNFLHDVSKLIKFNQKGEEEQGQDYRKIGSSSGSSKMSSISRVLPDWMARVASYLPVFCIFSCHA